MSSRSEETGRDLIHVAKAIADLPICETCGTQTEHIAFKEMSIPVTQRTLCPICADDRQYIPQSGQTWTTLTELARKGEHKNVIKPILEDDPDLLSIHTEPRFAIGQRAFLIKSPQGNILWDCISYIDNDTVEQIKNLGGIKAIAISHPHYYTTSLVWAEVFGAELWINQLDANWLQRKASPHVKYWLQTHRLSDDVELVRVGAHFPGSAVLHIKSEKTLLVADSIMVTAEMRNVTVLYSYPNMIPAPAEDVAFVWKAIRQLDWDRMLGAFDGKDLFENAKAITEESLKRIIRKIGPKPLDAYLS